MVSGVRRCVVLVLLSGCFGDAAMGGAVTSHAPAPPSGDGFYYRLGVGLGWANAWGMLQATGDLEWVGDVAATGGAARATVFLDSWETEHGVAGIGIAARAFHGTGIGDSRATDELSLGFAGGGVNRDDPMLVGFDLSLSMFSTTFDDRPPMRSYGLSLGASLDPESFIKLLGCIGVSYCPND